MPQHLHAALRATALTCSTTCHSTYMQHCVPQHLHAALGATALTIYRPVTVRYTCYIIISHISRRSQLPVSCVLPCCLRLSAMLLLASRAPYNTHPHHHNTPSSPPVLAGYGRSGRCLISYHVDWELITAAYCPFMGLRTHTLPHARTRLCLSMLSELSYAIT